MLPLAGHKGEALEPFITTSESNGELTNDTFQTTSKDRGFQQNLLNINSVAAVRERTIPTERQPPVGAVSANFCG
jgi:hypothetical protein